jgi:hypothetical protein
MQLHRRNTRLLDHPLIKLNSSSSSRPRKSNSS